MEYEAFYLRSYQGKQITLSYDGNAEFESHVLVERAVPARTVKPGGRNQLWPITNGTRRETVRLH